MSHITIPDRVGRLTATGQTSYLEYGGTKLITLECLCDCGNLIWPVKYKYTSGRIKSCGCQRKEVVGAIRRSHGYTRTRTYRSYRNMLNRCYYENYRSYKWYGGRGITVCERWRDKFENFLEDMGECPSKKHTLDRIETDGNYEPNNCRWATMTEQANNKRNNKKLMFRGELLGITQIARLTGIPRPSISNWLNKYQMSDEQTIAKIEERLKP